MSWHKFHTISEKAAAQADELTYAGRGAEAQKHLIAAAKNEERALSYLNSKEKPRTYAITAVSSAALWYKAGKFARARRVAERSLRERRLAEFAVKELTELLKKISLAEPKRAMGPWELAAAAAACVLVVSLGTGYFVHAKRIQLNTFATRTGMTRVVSFEDGSKAYLNTRSEIRWVPSKVDRHIVLLKGEVLFAVAPNATRPFRVTLGESEIHVLGTEFNVYRRADGENIVTVLQGAVNVDGSGPAPQWSHTLQANQQIQYRVPGEPAKVRSVDGASAIKWREGVYQFDNERIADVVAELGRYTDKRIVPDPRVAEIRVSGRLTPQDLPNAMRNLSLLAPVTVSGDENTIRLSYAESQGDQGGKTPP